MSTWIETVSALAQDCHADDTVLILITTPAQPMRTDTWSSGTLDQRTNPRLYYWNRLATQMALGHGWAVVDAFDATIGFADDPLCVDLAHCKQKYPPAHLLVVLVLC